MFCRFSNSWLYDQKIISWKQLIFRGFISANAIYTIQIKAERGVRNSGCRFLEHSQATLKDLCAEETRSLDFSSSPWFLRERTPLTFVPIARHGVSIHVSIHRPSWVYNVNSFIGDYVIITLVADTFASRRSSTIRISLLFSIEIFSSRFKKKYTRWKTFLKTLTS